MKRLLLLLALLWPLPASAQLLPPGPVTITVVDSGTKCVTAPAACATFDVQTSTSVAFDVSGTWTGTLTFEGSANGGPFNSILVTNTATGARVTTTTANGTFSVPNGGFVTVRARATATVTGTATVSATRGFATANVPSAPSFPGSFTAGDIVVATNSQTLAGLNDVAVGQVLASGGVGVAPAYTANPVVSSVTGGAASGSALTVAGTSNAVPLSTAYILLNPLGGNVGIGTTVPGVKLHIYESGAASVVGKIEVGNLEYNAGLELKSTTDWLIQSGGSLSAIDGKLSFYDGTDYRMVIAPTTGNVGIGTTGPGSPLTVNGNLAFTTSSSGAGVVAISATAPTIASGGCTSPAVTWANGTATFLLTLGSSCTGVKTITLTMPTASNFWAVDCTNNTSDAAQALMYVVPRATSATAVVLTSYGRVSGLPLDYVAANTLLCKSSGG